jgi:hypothetical protein
MPFSGPGVLFGLTIFAIACNRRSSPPVYNTCNERLFAIGDV